MRGDLLILLSDGLAILCLARFLLQWAGLDSRHPLAAFCRQITGWLVAPLARLLPAGGNKEWACILAVFLLYYAVFTVMALLALPGGFGTKIIAANLILAALGLLKSAAYVLLIGLVMRTVSSFSNPYSPLAAALQRIFGPMLRPFTFLRAGRMDFSAALPALVLWLWLAYFLPRLTVGLNLWLLR
ncbi:YggT family protein [Bergeriella denitrificans]|uniref:YGGT family n=1 Tax=Bergeriella denitrificans TaxID=494 RepID=A0A378UJ76_BERDE|nr:YggT family protein [Bergeriella denitrificans]STZ77190.1 YGGT family [Bergeriella denitrificans]